MCARFRFERWLFLSAITHSFHARALGVDASMAVSFVAVGVRVSSRFFLREGKETLLWRTSFPKVLARKAENAKISKLAKKKKTKRYNNDNDRTSPAFRSFGESCSLSL